MDENDKKLIDEARKRGEDPIKAAGKLGYRLVTIQDADGVETFKIVKIK